VSDVDVTSGGSEKYQKVTLVCFCGWQWWLRLFVWFVR
jgi:hypothetical protein